MRLACNWCCSVCCSVCCSAYCVAVCAVACVAVCDRQIKMDTYEQIMCINQTFLQLVLQCVW